MIQPDTVETVGQRQDALDLMGADHCREHVRHAQRCAAVHQGLARQVIRDREDAQHFDRGGQR